MKDEWINLIPLRAAKFPRRHFSMGGMVKIVFAFTVVRAAATEHIVVVKRVENNVS